MNEQKLTPVFEAARSPSEEALIVLVEAGTSSPRANVAAARPPLFHPSPLPLAYTGADVCEADSAGRTVLHYASSHDLAAAIPVIVKAGSFTSRCCPPYPLLFLLLLCFFSLRYAPAVAQVRTSTPSMKAAAAPCTTLA